MIVLLNDSIKKLANWKTVAKKLSPGWLNAQWNSQDEDPYS
jgi:hypothetical protein